MQYLDLPMVKVECYCGGDLWVLPNSMRETKSFKCLECNSTIYQIINRELEDEFIEYIRSQNI